MKILILVLAVFAIGCDRLFPVDVGTSSARGVVRRIDYVNHMITLDHERIPNLLEAMTFAYPVRKDSLMNGLLPQDTVAFTLTESSPGNFVVQSLRRVGIPKTRTVPILTPKGAPIASTTKKSAAKR